MLFNYMLLWSRLGVQMNTVTWVFMIIAIGELGVTIWSLIHAFRSKRLPEIVLLREQTIALYDEIVKSIPELSVSYKQVPIQNNHVLSKGVLVNTGKKDITEAMITKPITISIGPINNWGKHEDNFSFRRCSWGVQIRKRHAHAIGCPIQYAARR